ncbi:t-SNARE domain-containing protein 1 [Holothuria leucospilota]|uniref:t-SNARE domain-containing protein 1 n=1 Tax=Holothuria leucospilota TaxID=206669 RepID=A0A9Q1CSU9_HOLLE|nr:t-SNARE domain-containing protein 1 [Holothuria leucospilota]
MAAQESTKIRREPNFSEEERLCLLNFVQQHKIKLLGKAGRPGHGDDKVEERKAKYWKLCAQSIKAAGGRERDWKKVRKQWFDLKDKAKKLKSEMGVTGGGPKPSSSASMELAMEVVAREALEGIRKRATEVDPMGHASVEMSQESSQDSETSTQLPPNASAVGSTAYSEPATTTLPSAEPSSAATGSLVALQQQVNLLQSQIEELQTQPSSLQRATELRQLKFQEELLKLEKKKVDLQSQSLELQRKMLVALESLSSHTLLRSMSEQ